MPGRRQGYGRHMLARVIGLGLAASVLTISGVGYAAAVSVSDQIRHVDVFSSMTNRPPERGGENILLVGSDDRTGLSRAQKQKLHVGAGDYGRHTDTIMLLHIADDGSVGVVSIPRDSYVEIPAYTDSSGRTVRATNQKINAAYDIGGPTLITQTVEQATGVRIDHYAEINFAGFVAMVDALGGVPITTTSDIHDEKAGLDLPAGTTNLNGAQALGYVRARYFDPTADLGRMKRQQSFLDAMFTKATNPSTLLNPVKMMSFASAAASSLTVDEDLGRDELWHLIASARAGSAKDVTFETVPVAADVDKAGVGAVVLWDEQAAASLFSTLNSGRPIGGSAASSVTPVEVAPSGIRVQVFNGSKISGQGSRARSDLVAAGYDVVGQASSAKTSDRVETLIQYDPRYDRSLLTLKASFPDADAVPVNNLGRTFNVIVGSEYSGPSPVRVAS